MKMKMKRVLLCFCLFSMVVIQASVSASENEEVFLDIPNSFFLNSSSETDDGHLLLVGREIQDKNNIPTAFCVSRDGQVLWKYHPELMGNGKIDYHAFQKGFQDDEGCFFLLGRGHNIQSKEEESIIEILTGSVLETQISFPYGVVHVTPSGKDLLLTKKHSNGVVFRKINRSLETLWETQLEEKYHPTKVIPFDGGFLVLGYDKEVAKTQNHYVAFALLLNIEGEIIWKYDCPVYCEFTDAFITEYQTAVIIGNTEVQERYATPYEGKNGTNFIFEYGINGIEWWTDYDKVGGQFFSIIPTGQSYIIGGYTGANVQEVFLLQYSLGGTSLQEWSETIPNFSASRKLSLHALNGEIFLLSHGQKEQLPTNYLTTLRKVEVP